MRSVKPVNHLLLLLFFSFIWFSRLALTDLREIYVDSALS